jgi:UDP-N-acetylglucosamine--N-acetylmuramyl-(pentapeptide) pyrophosphoryl-undecaprenol N-acetylglucosamine transferase
MSYCTHNPIIVVAGGSGGHVFPAIALAEYAHQQGEHIILITDTRGARFIEKDRSFFSHIEILPPASVRTAFSIYQTIKTLYQQHPAKAVVGFGGITTVAPLFMARIKGIRCAIHQSDAILGRANRFLAPLMDSVFVGHGLECYGKHISKSKTHQWRTISTPVRQAFTAITAHTSISLPLHILIIGGSQGAKIWSTLLPQALAMLSADQQKSLRIRHQSLQSDCTDLAHQYSRLNLDSFQVAPFFSDMVDMLSWSHVVFSRAGASTLAELSCAQRPAFLVPYPFAIDHHQYFNACAHAQSNRSWMVPEAELTALYIADKIRSWLDKPDELLYGEQQIKMPQPGNACPELFSFCTSP